MLKLYNTLGRKKEIFKPLKDKKVGMYVCGPTIYNYVHIGNLRAYFFGDILRKYLEFKGFKVKEVMNLTDVDDKTIKESQKYKVKLRKFTEIYEKAFLDDLKAMNIQIPYQFRRPTYDWDVYSHSAFKDADKIEDLLDNIFHRDIFYTISVPLSENPKKKVYRVINRLTGKSVADFVYRKDMPPYIVVDSIRYASLLYLKKKLEKILKNPNMKHRWIKARADLERINKAIEYMRRRLGR